MDYYRWRHGLKNILTIIFLFITIHLAWDASISPEVTGYKLYHGTQSRTYGTPVDVGLVTDYYLPNVDETQPMFFAATAYNATLESDYSAELEVITENRTIARGKNNNVTVIKIVDGAITGVTVKTLPTIRY